MTIDTEKLEAALDALPDTYRGPGGTAGVVKDGKVVATRAWGYADLVTHRPLTTGTRMPICSISKQFTCAVLLASVGDPDALNARVGEFLPNYRGPLPTVRQLCDNQSGLRDYWALTVLQGGLAEQTFSRGDALALLGRMKTGHFAPGTRYSYCNCNFRIVSELIESETGRALEDLYREIIWGPAGMEGAVLTADTRHPADDVFGYEGSEGAGYFTADNGIFWIGDAGISASLDDMMAYEAWIDRTRDDPVGLYRRLSKPPAFSDGTPAAYGMGLAHKVVAGMHTTGHGGALRGFRAHRLHAAEERLSVFVQFNHEADAQGAAVDLMKAALGWEDPAPGPVEEDWRGQWMCPETGLLTRVEPGRRGALLRFATGPDRLRPSEDGRLVSDSVAVARTDGRLEMRRAGENLAVTMEPVPAAAAPDRAEIAGRYESEELGAAMVIEARDGGVYARFEGLLGAGRMERVHAAAPDIWTLVTRRSMDAPAPGDWTLRIDRDGSGAISGATLGCWLARGVVYRRTA